MRNTPAKFEMEDKDAFKYVIISMHSEYRNETSGIDKIAIRDTQHPLYNQQRIKVSNPKAGSIYIRNGKKIIYK